MNDLFENSEGKLLTFLLGTQEYGIKILEAREVVGMMHIDPGYAWWKSHMDRGYASCVHMMYGLCIWMIDDPYG